MALKRGLKYCWRRIRPGRSVLFFSLLFYSIFYSFFLSFFLSSSRFSDGRFRSYVYFVFGIVFDTENPRSVWSTSAVPDFAYCARVTRLCDELHQNPFEICIERKTQPSDIYDRRREISENGETPIEIDTGSLRDHSTRPNY